MSMDYAVERIAAEESAVLFILRYIGGRAGRRASHQEEKRIPVLAAAAAEYIHGELRCHGEG